MYGLPAPYTPCFCQGRCVASISGCPTLRGWLVVSPKAVAQARAHGRGTLNERAVQVLRSREESEAYVASVCFKHGPPRLIGVELEWLLARRAVPPRSLSAAVAPGQLDSAVLTAALGPHTPISLDPLSPALPLPLGSTVTVEPGGQVELASQPFADLG